MDGSREKVDEKGWNLSLVLGHVSLEGLPIEIKLSARKDEIIPGTVMRRETLVVEMKSRHRDNPEQPWLVATEQKMPLFLYESFWHHSKATQFREFMLLIRQAVMLVLVHEMDEQLKVDGKRFFDAHKKDADAGPTDTPSSAD